ncbi:MAG: ORF6N domain-containing protein [Rhizobacter sp.]|nr:ORF6N domain-containing protein [Chlorobiales bacterium]
MATKKLAIPTEHIARSIYFLRSAKVMLDSDLAALYGISTKRFNEQVKRNLERFPPDFMFQLSKEEYENLRSQLATSSSGYGGRRYSPYAFTKLGVAMLSSVLNSPKAIAVNIEIMRAFVRLREVMATHKDLARKVEALEREVKDDRQENQEKFAAIFEVIQQLIEAPEPKKSEMGFRPEKS